MNKSQITKFLDKCEKNKNRSIVIVDFANVNRWQDSTNWHISINKLGKLISHLSAGRKYLRRFYFGEDYGQRETSRTLLPWSEMILNQAKYSGFDIVTKRVKYIIDPKYQTGYVKKCDLDVEMAIDLVKEKDNYDTAYIFSGDGDLAYVFDYLHNEFHKKIYVFGARDHLGKELVDARINKLIEDIIFIEDFEYRLDITRP